METEPRPDMLTARRSTSQRRTYRACGQRWFLSYMAGWKQQRSRGTYAFGSRMHDMAYAIILRQVRTKEEVRALWAKLWQPYAEDQSLTWTSRASWKLLAERGVALAEKMLLEFPAIFPEHPGVQIEERIEYNLGGATELAIIDYYGPLGWPFGGPPPRGLLPTVLDFKTSDREYKSTAAELDEQLTDYQLAEESKGRPVEVVGLCVLIYSAAPKIQWLLCPARDEDEKDRFIASAQTDERRIRAEEFPRNTGACYTMGECAFVPVCYPSQAGRIKDELLRAEGATADAETSWEDGE